MMKPRPGGKQQQGIPKHHHAILTTVHCSMYTRLNTSSMVTRVLQQGAYPGIPSCPPELGQRHQVLGAPHLA
jgi:hypothetical protein